MTKQTMKQPPDAKKAPAKTQQPQAKKPRDAAAVEAEISKLQATREELAEELRKLPEKILEAELADDEAVEEAVARGEKVRFTARQATALREREGVVKDQIRATERIELKLGIERARLLQAETEAALEGMDERFEKAEEGVRQAEIKREEIRTEALQLGERRRSLQEHQVYLEGKLRALDPGFAQRKAQEEEARRREETEIYQRTLAEHTEKRRRETFDEAGVYNAAQGTPASVADDARAGRGARVL